jgi:hypothetical protein
MKPISDQIRVGIHASVILRCKRTTGKPHGKHCVMLWSSEYDEQTPVERISSESSIVEM